MLVRRHEAVDDFDDAAAGSQRVLRFIGSRFLTLHRESF